MAEYAVVPQSMVHRVPPSVSPLEAALVEPLSVAHHAVAFIDSALPECVAVFGAGPIGIGVVQFLKIHGVPKVVVVEPAPARQAVVANMAVDVIDPKSANVVEHLLSLTDGYGVDMSFDTAGAPTSFVSAVASTTKGGTVVLVASCRQPVEAPLATMVARQLKIQSSFAYCGDFTSVIDILGSGRIQVADWVSVVQLDDVVDTLHKLRDGQFIKALVQPN